MVDLNTQLAIGREFGSVQQSALSKEKGWPVDVGLIHLDGTLQETSSTHPRIYYVQNMKQGGYLTLQINDEGSQNLTTGMQVAIPANSTYKLIGSGVTLYEIECSEPGMGGDLSVEDFDDDAKKNKCPCGDSYRIPLFDIDWILSTHRTVMNDVEEKDAGGFKGHQHADTPEIYFVTEGTGTIFLNGVPFDLYPGMMFAIPLGTMHYVESNGPINMHISVFGGHDDGDFLGPDFKPLKGH